jgi:pimeloyl-ACP methyl ester carboxylesterase
MALTEVRLPLRLDGRDFSLAAWQRETGSDELLVCVHGLGCSKQTFADAWQHDELRHWSLLAFDLPGFGRSPRPPDYSHDLAEQARLLQAVLDARASRRIVLLAHSMGGTLALLQGQRALDRLTALILVEARLLTASSTISAEAARFDFEAFERTFLPAFRARVALDPSQAFDLERADPTAFYRSAQSLGYWTRQTDLVARFRQLSCPAWFIYGDRNAHLGELAVLPPEQLLTVPAAAHFPMQDNPEAFYARLGGLLQQLSG